MCGDASNENKTQGEAKTTPTCNAPHQQDQRNGDTPAAPPLAPQDRSDRSNSKPLAETFRSRSLPCPAAASANQPAKWWARASGESTWNFSLKNQNQNHRGNKEFVPHVRFPSSLSCSFISLPPRRWKWSRSRPSHHSPRRLLAANNQSPTLHARPAVSSRLVRRRRGTNPIDRSIHESSSPRTLAVCIVLVPLPTRASVFTRHQPASDTVLHATLLNGCYCR